MSRDRTSTRINTYTNSENTNFVLNWLNIINVFFISNIGPNTRKAIIALSLNVLRNDEAIKASAEEQSDKI
jgi:hypothetical protein